MGLRIKKKFMLHSAQKNSSQVSISILQRKVRPYSVIERMKTVLCMPDSHERKLSWTNEGLYFIGVQF